MLVPLVLDHGLPTAAGAIVSPMGHTSYMHTLERFPADQIRIGDFRRRRREIVEESPGLIPLVDSW